MTCLGSAFGSALGVWAVWVAWRFPAFVWVAGGWVACVGGWRACAAHHPCGCCSQMYVAADIWGAADRHRLLHVWAAVVLAGSGRCLCVCGC